jgi:hypothetical protein
MRTKAPLLIPAAAKVLAWILGKENTQSRALYQVGGHRERVRPDQAQLSQPCEGSGTKIQIMPKDLARSVAFRPLKPGGRTWPNPGRGPLERVAVGHNSYNQGVMVRFRIPA